MTTQSDLRACLLPLVAGGVHFGTIPVDNKMWPAICLPTEIITPDNTICGSSDLENYRVQIDVYAPSYGVVVTLRKQVFDAVELMFPHAERINDLADYDADLKLHRRIIEYGIKAE